MRCSPGFSLLLVLLLGAPAVAGPWDVPPEGSCQPAAGLRGWPPGQDAPPIPFAPGDTIGHERAEILRNYLPPEIWEHRDKFFYEGMRLEIGACFRDYSAPGFYQEATAQFAGKPQLDAEGALRGYTAGRPFPPEKIDPADSQAGHKWAWNVEFRYQGAGFGGKFRIMDMVGRTHRGEPFEGEIFKWQLNFRNDQAKKAYKAKGAKSYQWAAGGLFFMPFAAREFSWRQFRDVGMLTEARRTDDLHAYLPEWRRVRRLPATDTEGLYLPSFGVGVVPATELTIGGGGGGAAGLGAGGMGGGGVSGGTGGGAAASSIKPSRNGFEGLEIRPLLYRYKVRGVQDVLSPINANQPAYPENKDRGFGSWGLSFASDRWDLRRALVLEATAKHVGSGTDAAKQVYYIDLQTGQPLFLASWDKRGEIIDVGMYVGRWSEDRESYPAWPDDAERAIRVIDPAGAAMANVRDEGGWRRESWDIVATPPKDSEMRRLLSVGQLTKRR
ncbi:MAG: DUF1329 domain-containing protein [Deltaproteobacteria bacterium]|nr:DUF1329 domain-containing protein [Deltaproteobacteria bacterium]